MHESTFARLLLEQVLAHTRQAGARRVIAIDIQIGEWLGIQEHSLLQWFHCASAGTEAEGVHVRIHPERARFLCTGCGVISESSRDNCPVCGGMLFYRDGGRDCVLESMEVEE